MSTPTVMHMGRDCSGAPTYALPICNNIYDFMLSAGVAVTWTVPSDVPVWQIDVVPEVGGEVLVSYDGVTPHNPTTATVTRSNTDYNPVARDILAGTVLNFLTQDTTCRVWIYLYSKSST